MTDEHQHSDLTPLDANGNCASCHQPIRTREEAPARKRRPRLVITIPEGEDGILEDLLAQLADKYEEAFPEIIKPVGERMWVYRAVHFAALAALQADLVPTEEGA